MRRNYQSQFASLARPASARWTGLRRQAERRSKPGRFRDGPLVIPTTLGRCLLSLRTLRAAGPQHECPPQSGHSGSDDETVCVPSRRSGYPESRSLGKLRSHAQRRRVISKLPVSVAGRTSCFPMTLYVSRRLSGASRKFRYLPPRRNRTRLDAGDRSRNLRDGVLT
jgi:hypothetical protein